jgi:restriction system protein
LEGNIVILLLIVAIVVFLLYTRDRPPKTPAAVELTRRLGTVRYMSGAQFEGFVAEIMRGLGYRATILGGSGDQGVDVIAAAGKERIAIQCKNYAKAVGNKPVQEVYAGSRYHGCNSAWVVAPSGFTKGAAELARRVGVVLYDAQAIRTWIRRIDEKERDREKKKPALQTRRKVDLDAGSTGQKEATAMESGMEKHTVYVGKDTLGETVSFTAKLLGIACVNSGKEAEGGFDFSYYRLPDHTYRVLIDGGDLTILMPSNMMPTNMLEAWARGEPVDYGRWTLEELQAEPDFGRVFRELMKNHPESKHSIVRDLD